jgi:hypothetical protein
MDVLGKLHALKWKTQRGGGGAAAAASSANGFL